MTFNLNSYVIYVVFLLTFISMVTSLRNECSGNFHAVKGKRMLSEGTRNGSSVPLNSLCARTCLRDPKCLSFNFNRASGICEMNSETCLASDERCNDDDEYAHFYKVGQVSIFVAALPSFSPFPPFLC